jgi:hypothetical protein
MPVTYSSDHDWEKHSTFDIENLFGTNSENDDVNNFCTISVIHVPSNDEYDIFGPPTVEEKISYDYNMPPIFDDHGDENNSDSYIVNSIHDAT